MASLFTKAKLLDNDDVDELHSFLQFQRSIQHHVMMGNINMTQIAHFLIMMTYMSFCRSSHFHTECIATDVSTINATIDLAIVMCSFQTKFFYDGIKAAINLYFNNLKNWVKRRVAIIITKYSGQRCLCRNHVQHYPCCSTQHVLLPVLAIVQIICLEKYKDDRPLNLTEYWVRDWLVYGRNPVNVKSRKKTQVISQPKLLFSRTSKQEERRFCPTLYHSEHNNIKAVWALLLCTTFKEAAYAIACLWCDYVTGFTANIKY